LPKSLDHFSNFVVWQLPSVTIANEPFSSLDLQQPLRFGVAKTPD
jgi:hypothetical protein